MSERYLGHMETLLLSHIECGHCHLYCSLPASPRQSSPAGLQIQGSARMGLGQSLAGGSEEVTLEVTLWLGFSPEAPLRGRNVAWSWSRVTWKAGQVSGSS